MNVALDGIIRRAARDPEYLEAARTNPAEVASSGGVTPADVEAVTAGDLVRLHARGAHPLLLMHLAGALSIDPMVRLRDGSREPPVAETRRC